MKIALYLQSTQKIPCANYVPTICRTPSQYVYAIPTSFCCMQHKTLALHAYSIQYVYLTPHNITHHSLTSTWHYRLGSAHSTAFHVQDNPFPVMMKSTAYLCSSHPNMPHRPSTVHTLQFLACKTEHTYLPHNSEVAATYNTTLSLCTTA